MLKTWLGRLTGAYRSFPAPAPDAPLVVIGDIHGRYDLLQRLLAKVEGQGQLICVGDYVDRGDDSASVLRLLVDRPDILCLKGNHEEMLEGFLARPEENDGRWLRYGGLQTLASYGVRGLSETSSGAQLKEARDALVAAMGQGQINWLAGLTSSYFSGNVFVTHAGADPAVAIDAQSFKTLRWGHPDFAKTPRRDGIWVAHGHTIVDEPSARAGRIAVDTGGYATGRLTAARITAEGVSFVTA